MKAYGFMDRVSATFRDLKDKRQVAKNRLDFSKPVYLEQIYFTVIGFPKSSIMTTKYLVFYTDNEFVDPSVLAPKKIERAKSARKGYWAMYNGRDPITGPHRYWVLQPLSRAHSLPKGFGVSYDLWDLIDAGKAILLE